MIPGSVPSWNKSYRVSTVKGIDKRGRPYERGGITKREEARLWQEQMANIVRAARPRGWAPTGWVWIVYRPYFATGRHPDMDNMLKMVHDVIQAATGVNDKWFLPCFPEPPVLGVGERDARIEVTISG